MTSQLPKYGIQAVIDGLPNFLKGMDSINKKIDDATKSSGAAGKKVDPLSSAFDKMGTSVDKVREKLKNFIQDNVPFGNQLGSILDKLVAIPLPALAAAAAIVGLGAAFLALGNRGAPLQEIGTAFDHLTANIGINSQTLLKDLRAASEGTIADFDLIKTASNALLGVSGNLGKSLGNELPNFLKIAKAEADATGRSVNDLFNNLVEGVKKGTPKLIENTGLIIDQKKAYQDYAQTLGIAVTQMSDTDRSMALLAATLDAGKLAVDSLSGSLESNADKLDRQQATITNTLDGLAIAVQPAFGVVLDAVQKVLNIFQELGQAVGPIFGGILSIIAGVFSTIVDVVTSVAQPIVDAFASIAPYIALVFQFIAKVVNGVGKIIGDVVGGIVKFLSDVGKRLFGLDLKTLGPQLFNGAAAAFGSFANGIIAVANKLIFPAVIAIAKFIADFLIGFSPPKEGPLSMIDKGGENLMIAWLDGIAGVSLDPVNQVAAQVSAALGSIGSAGLGKVNARLAQLDKALLPFQNRLAIVKSQFDALAEPAKLALDAIDRQTQALQDAVAQGDPKAAERLRILDEQRAAIQGQLDAQQAIVDRAQIQLALAQAQQAPERTLLQIRQAYLNALIKVQGKTATGVAGATTHPPSGAGGVVTPPEMGGGAVTAGAGGLPSVLDLIGGQSAVDNAANGLSSAFMGAIDQSGLQDFAQNSLDLSTQFDRIKSFDLGAKLKDKFKGLTDVFDPGNPDSIPAKITGFVGHLTADANDPDSIAHFFANIGSNIANTKDSIFSAVSTFASDLFNPASPNSISANINGFVSHLTAGPEDKDSVAHLFSTMGDNLSALKDVIGPQVTDLLSGIFDPNVKDSPMNQILTLVGQVTGDANVPGEVADYFANLPTNISNAASGLYDQLKTNVFDPVITFLTGSDEGTIGDVINKAVNLFSNLGPGIVAALQNFGGMVYNAIVVPIINIMNAGITAIESGIRNIASFFSEFLAQVIGGFDNTQVAGTNLGGLVPQALRDFQAGLHSIGTSFTIGRISTALPAFLQPLGGATGGIFGPGLMKVGERGSELMWNASKMGVIPHELTSVLTDLTSILAQPQAQPVYAGNSYQDSHNWNVTMNGVQGGDDAMRRMSLLRARR